MDIKLYVDKLIHKTNTIKKVLCVLIILCMSVMLYDNVYGENVNQDSKDNVNDNAQSDNNYNMNSTTFKLDNVNIYEGMNESYATGYVPKIENNAAMVVLPLSVTGDVKNNIINATVNLGDVSNSPFVWKNYNKSIPLTENVVNGGNNSTVSYVIRFDLSLNPERYNGVYPVSVSVRGEDNQGMEIQGEYTVYVVINDGKKKEDGTQPSTAAELTPKVMVDNYTFSRENVMAGDEVTVNIQMKNHSNTKEIKNLSAAIQENGEYFTLINKSAGVYVGDISADGTATISYTYRVATGTPSAQYDFALTYDYADGLGNVFTGTENIKMPVGQPVNVQFDKVDLGEKAEVADRIMVNVHAMNMGRGQVRNVRAVMDMEGLSVAETIFMGDIEAGAEASDSVTASVNGLSGDSPYGHTSGTITFIYEDASGNSYESVQDIELDITSPFADVDVNKEEPDKPNQWWKIMLITGGVIIVIAIYILGRKLYLKRIIDKAVDDSEDIKQNEED